MSSFYPYSLLTSEAAERAYAGSEYHISPNADGTYNITLYADGEVIATLPDAAAVNEFFIEEFKTCFFAGFRDVLEAVGEELDTLKSVSDAETLDASAVSVLLSSAYALQAYAADVVDYIRHELPDTRRAVK